MKFNALFIVVVAGLAVIWGLWRVKTVLGSDVIGGPTTAPSYASATTQPAGPLNYTMKDIDGKDVKLADYKGKVVMIVNVASKCGFTPQYKGLEALYEKYKDQGFVILGFPANNFKSQEPGTDADIKAFCSSKYEVTFPMMSKISVKGDDKDPLYQFLTSTEQNGQFGGEIGWNFTKFLVDRNGQVSARFASATTPEDAKLVGAVEKALTPDAKTP